MPGLAVRESVTVAGRAERARVARAFTVAVLDPGHPCGNDAMPALPPADPRREACRDTHAIVTIEADVLEGAHPVRGRRPLD